MRVIFRDNLCWKKHCTVVGWLCNGFLYVLILSAFRLLTPSDCSLFSSVYVSIISEANSGTKLCWLSDACADHKTHISQKLYFQIIYPSNRIDIRMFQEPISEKKYYFFSLLLMMERNTAFFPLCHLQTGKFICEKFNCYFTIIKWNISDTFYSSVYHINQKKIIKNELIKNICILNLKNKCIACVFMHSLKILRNIYYIN